MNVRLVVRLLSAMPRESAIAAALGLQLTVLPSVAHHYDLVGGVALVWGGLFKERQKYQDAISSFEIAIHAFTQAHDQLGVAKSLNGLSEVCLAVGQWSRARSLSRAVMAIAYDVPTLLEESALAHYVQGVSALHLEEFRAADTALQEALGLYMALEEPLWENRTLLQMGRLYRAQKLFMFAIACYESVINGLLPYLAATHEVANLLFETLYHTGQLSGEMDCQGWEADAYQQVSHHYIAADQRRELAQLFSQLGQRHEADGTHEIALGCYAQMIAIYPQRLPVQLPDFVHPAVSVAVAA